MWDCPCASHFIQGMDTTWQPCPKQKRRWEGGKCPFSFCCCCLQAAASADFSNRFSVWSFPHFLWTCHILPTKSLYISEKKCYTKGMSTHHFRKSLIMYVRVCVHMCWKHLSEPSYVTPVSKFTSVIPTTGTISKYSLLNYLYILQFSTYTMLLKQPQNVILQLLLSMDFFLSQETRG